MWSNRAALAVLGVLTLWSGLAAQAASKTAPRSQTSKAKHDPVEALYGALLLNTAREHESLYRACGHSNFTALAWALHGVHTKIDVVKSEYETEAEFSARKAKAEDLLSQVGKLVVCQPLDDNEDAPFEYDAEREVFKGTFRTHENVWRDTKRVGKYVSKTRMGVRATVTSSIDIEYDVDMPDALRLPTDCLKWDYAGASYEVPVQRAEAPSVKAHGYLVFCRPSRSSILRVLRLGRISDARRSE